MARPRSTKPKNKEEGFTADERIAEVEAAKPPAPGVRISAEPPSTPEPQPTAQEGCPRRAFCANSDADPSYCAAMPEGCGGFRRASGQLDPAAREREKVRQHISATRTLHGNEIPQNLRDPVNLADAMREAREARLDREEPKHRYGDFRSYEKRSPRW